MNPARGTQIQRRLRLKSFQSPGDIVMLTAAVRDLHRAYPRHFLTDVKTSAPEIWKNNPHVTGLREDDADVDTLDMHYPLIHQSNQRPYHFIHGYIHYLEAQLGLRIPVTEFRGDIHLSDEERRSLPPGVELGVPDCFWIVVAGGKSDFTAKWWDPASYQEVVDHFQGRIRFVQCGEGGHWHPRLKGVVDLVGKTTLREFIRLIYHAEGVVCPVTLAMHLAAAVETKAGCPPIRPCVVVAGGREPAHWEAYPNHQLIATNGMLRCCAQGGCWKSRCQLVGDGDPKDLHNVCEHPVQVREDLRIPLCMDMITHEQVIDRIELYYKGDIMANNNGPSVAVSVSGDHGGGQPRSREKISVSFYHGLGDCAHFAHLIPLYARRGYKIEVECTPDKRILFHAAGASTIENGAAREHPWGYPPGGTHEGHGRSWQGSKMAHNISEPPLPNIGDKIGLWQEYCDSRIDIEPHLPDAARQQADAWLGRLPRPVVLFHSKGNTAQARKSLPDDVAARFYRAFLDACDGSLVLLDWDSRVPRLASYRVRHLGDFGSCATEVLLALIGRADLIVGVDSGPLHAARFTKTPTVGIWMPGHYPTTYSLPRVEQLNVVLADHTRQWNKFKRIPWNIVEHPGQAFDAERLAEFCHRMLCPPRYLPREQIAADVQLQQIILKWCRGAPTAAYGSYADRNRSFDVLFQEMTRRFEEPTVVETGVIRAEEDWSGAGYFTYLAGAYLYRSGGRLHSVDIAPQPCEFARQWTDVFGDTVSIHCQDSIEFLTQFQQPIDVLYLDSLDTTEPGHAEHAVREMEAALPNLKESSLVVFDDTPWCGGSWTGKGAAAVPRLLADGWRILYAGYQVILARQ